MTATATAALAWVRAHGTAVGMALLALLALGSGTALTLDRMYGVPEGAVFRLGHTVLTEQQMAARAKLYGLVGLQTPTDPARLDEFRRAMAKTVAVEQVLANAAAALNIVIPDKTANDKLTEMLEQTFPRGRDTFVARLAEYGVPEADVVDQVKRQLATGKLFEQITKDVPVPTDQDIAAAYEQRRAQLVNPPEQRHIRNIAVATEEQARQVRAELDKGTEFAALARQLSQDSQTKNNGGDLGIASRGQIRDRAFGDAAFAAPANSVFGPVATNGIWCVGQVLEVTPPVQLTLEQSRDLLRSVLFQARKSDTWARWMSDQLREANVRYADAYRPADPTGFQFGPSGTAPGEAAPGEGAGGPASGDPAAGPPK